MLALVAIFRTVWSLVISVFCTILLINLSCRLITKSITIPEKKFAIILPIIYFTAQCITFGISAADSILFYEIEGENEEYSNPVSATMSMISVFCILVSNVSWYLWMLLQLKSSFNDTVLKVPKAIMIFHFTFFGLIVLSALVIIFNNFILLKSESILRMSISIYLLFYYIGYYHMVWLFNRRLYKLMNIQLAETQSDISNIIRLTTKLATLYTIHSLVTIAMLTNTIIYTSMQDSLIMGTIFWFNVALYNCYMSLCMFLMMKFNEKYYGCLCKHCDAGFVKLCEYCAGKCAKKPNLKNVISSSIGTTVTQV